MNTRIQSEVHKLGSGSEIPPGEGREFVVSGQRVVIFHTRQGAFYGTQALCPHKEGPLVDGLIGGTTLMCPLHTMKFDLISGKALSGDCGIETYDVTLDPNGEILIRM